MARAKPKKTESNETVPAQVVLHDLPDRPRKPPRTRRPRKANALRSTIRYLADVAEVVDGAEGVAWETREQIGRVLGGIRCVLEGFQVDLVDGLDGAHVVYATLAKFAEAPGAVKKLELFP